jgi:hypothetical protein
MNLHPDPVTIRQAIGKDGWIEYRRDYYTGSTSWFRTGFDRPGPALRATLSDWRWKVGGEERRFTEEELKAVATFFQRSCNRREPAEKGKCVQIFSFSPSELQ